MYDAGESKYHYPGTDTLINRKNIKNKTVLEKYADYISAIKLAELLEEGITGEFNADHLCNIHFRIFDEIYDFAGKFRTENIAKDDFRFAEWSYIKDQLDGIMNGLKEENYLKGLNKDNLAERIAYYMAELNVLHPFREGNGRTIREFARQLALNAGFVLDFQREAEVLILEASIKSVIDIAELEEIIKLYLKKGK